ncbi:hypothetical protein ACLOJK_023524 [Asimina triloba]
MSLCRSSVSPSTKTHPASSSRIPPRAASSVYPGFVRSRLQQGHHRLPSASALASSHRPSSTTRICRRPSSSLLPISPGVASARPSSLSVVRLRASALPILARSAEQRRSASIRPALNLAGPPFAHPVDSRSTQSPTAILETGTPRSVHPRPRLNSALVDSSAVSAPRLVLGRSSPTAAPASGRLSGPDPIRCLPAVRPSAAVRHPLPADVVRCPPTSSALATVRWSLPLLGEEGGAPYYGAPGAH